MPNDVSIETAPNAGVPNGTAQIVPGTLPDDGRASAYENELKALGLSGDDQADNLAETLAAGGTPEPASIPEDAAEGEPAAGQTQPAAAAQAAPTPLPQGDEPPEDWAPTEDIKAALARLSKAQARPFRAAFFKNAQFEQYGFKPADAKLFKESGFTPERARGTLERFATAKDEQVALNLAASAQELEADFKGESPERFLQNLHAWDPDAFVRVVTAAAQIAPRVDPVTARATAQATYDQNLKWHFQQVRDNANRAGNAELAAAVDMMEIDAFGSIGSGAKPPTSGDPELDRQREELRLEKQRLAEERSRAFSQQANQFTNHVVNAARNTIRGELEKALAAQAPSGFSEKARQRVVDEAFALVEQQMARNPVRKNAVLGVLRQGGFDQQHAQNAFGYITTQARALIPAALQEKIADYLAITAPPAPPAPTRPSAPAPAPKPAASRATPSPIPPRQSTNDPSMGAPGWKGMNAFLDAFTARGGR